MTANQSTPTEGQSGDGRTEQRDSAEVEAVKSMVHTEVVQYADRQTSLDAEQLAEVLRRHADALDTEGYEAFRPGL
jgi:methylaspartate ammonia-lyase